MDVLGKVVKKIWYGLAVALQRASRTLMAHSESTDAPSGHPGKTSETDSAAPPADDQSQATLPSNGGPPDHWVQRVKDHAPELLLPRPTHTVFSNPVLVDKAVPDKEVWRSDPGKGPMEGVSSENSRKPDAPNGDQLQYMISSDAGSQLPVFKAAKHAGSDKENSGDEKRMFEPSGTSQAEVSPFPRDTRTGSTFATRATPNLAILPRKPEGQNSEMGPQDSHGGKTEKENLTQITADAAGHPSGNNRTQPFDGGLPDSHGVRYSSISEVNVSHPEKSKPEEKHRLAPPDETPIKPYNLDKYEIPPPPDITASMGEDLLATIKSDGSTPPENQLRNGERANAQKNPVRQKRLQPGELPSPQGFLDNNRPVEQATTENLRQRWPDLFQTGPGDIGHMDAKKGCWPELPENPAAETERPSNAEKAPCAHRQRDHARLARITAEQQGISWNGLHF